jgi:hypothetical protein
VGGTGLQLCIDPEDLGTLALIIYLAALRLTLAPVLGGSAAPSPKKNCSICCTMISWSWPSGVFSPGTRSRPTARWWVQISSTRVQ